MVKILKHLFLKRVFLINNFDSRGGYVVIPSEIEFWQGQTDRIHDRIRFRKVKEDEGPDNIITHPGNDGWLYERLQP